MSLFKDFKEFAVKGNMIDMAIGIIIGAAFTGIVNSLVKDIIMPMLGLLTGNVDFRDKQYILQEAVMDAQGQVIHEAISLRYGNFLQVVIDFVIIAFSIFLVIRFLNSLKRKSENPANPTVPTPKDIELLTDIRDLLKNQGK